MAKWNKGLVAAMEELEEMENEGAEAEGGADSLETSMIEANEAGADLDDMDSSIEEAVEGAEEIEAIADTLDETVEEGGADAATARVAEVAVESIFRRLNIKRKAMPSMESFGTRSSRVQATKIAVEGMKESAKMIWERIKKAIKAAWDWIQGWFNKLIDAATKLNERAKKFKEASAKLDGTPKEAKMAKGGFVDALTLGGEFNAGIAKKSVNALEVQVSASQAAATELLKAATKMGSTKLAELPEESDEDPLSEFKDVELPGNRKLEFKEGTFFKKKGIVVGTFNPKSEGFKGEEVEVAKAADIKAIAEAVVVLSQRVLDVRKDQEKLKKVLDQVNKAVDAVGKLSDEKEIEASRKKTAAITEFNSVTIALAKTMTGEAVRVGKAALDYAEKSMGQYGAGK